MTKFLSCLIILLGLIGSLNADLVMEKMVLFILASLSVIMLQVIEINGKIK